MTSLPPVNRRALLKGTAGLGAALSLPGGAIAISAEPAGPGEQRAGPWTYWYWLDANITGDGILTDLQAMSDAGIVGAIIFNVGGVNDATRISPPVESQDPNWWSALRLAAVRARELKISLAMNICDGWGTAGGAWIDPPVSAQELVWTRTEVAPGSRIPNLPQPLTRMGHYRDVATYAFPMPDQWNGKAQPQGRVSTSWDIADAARLLDPAQDRNVIETEEPGWIQVSFDRPFRLASVSVRSSSFDVLPFLSLGYSGAANSLIVQASDDGTTFRTIHRLVSPKLGWQANLTELDHAIPPVSARVFRFVHDPATVPVVPGHDGRMATTRKLALASLELSSHSTVDCRQLRSGEAWGVAPALTDMLLPATDCIALRDIVDISAYISPSGACSWRPSPRDRRRWMIVRVGATTNGQKTAPSGRQGGLECDKFDPQAVSLQFDRWFGEARRRIGPDLSDSVLKTLHMDSWEGRGQNWSEHLAKGFRERRGYDIGPFLLAMTGIPLENASATDGFLFDLRRTIGELLTDNFFGTIERLAHEHGCAFSAGATNASFPSDGVAIHRHVDIPCGEFWHARHNSDKPSDVMEAVSAAHLYGKPVIGAEAWTGGLDWSEHPFTFKRQGDENFCLGVNRMIFHVWAHQAFPDRTPGVTLFGLGSFFSQTQSWWPMAHAWVDYLSRCQHLLQQGRPVADLCYFIGEDMPVRAFLAKDLQPVLPRGYAFDSINADALWTLATVVDGRIVLPGGASYAVLVLPPDLAISQRTARKLEALAAAGATIYGPRPHAIISRQDEPASRGTETIIDKLWSGSGKGGIVSADEALSTVLRRIGVGPDLQCDAEHVMWTHRATPDRDIYFLSNQTDTPQELELTLRLPRAEITLFDPVEGRDYLLPPRILASGNQTVRLTLESFGSSFLLAKKASAEPRVSAVTPRSGGTTIALSESRGQLFAEGRTSGQWSVITGNGRDIAVEIDALPPEQPITGPWRITFDNAERSILPNVTELRSWTDEEDPAIRFHAGTALYTAVFNAPADRRVRWLLSLDHCANVAAIMLNGRDMGIIWVPGRTLDVTDALVGGKNRLDITVANTWRNRLIGDQRTGDPRAWILPNKLGRATLQKFTGNEPLLPAGLIGAVRLVPGFRKRIL